MATMTAAYGREVTEARKGLGKSGPKASVERLAGDTGLTEETVRGVFIEAAYASGGRGYPLRLPHSVSTLRQVAEAVGVRFKPSHYKES